jgi:hypothetical protein
MDKKQQNDAANLRRSAPLEAMHRPDYSTEALRRGGLAKMGRGKGLADPWE